MSPIIRFDQVSKSYHLRVGRPRSFRDLFLALLQPNGKKARGEHAHLLWALRDVSFEIQPGETIGLIGANGAGKSTCLKLISQIMAPTRGRVEVNGRVAALLELGVGFHPELSGHDNVFLSGTLAGISRTEMRRRYPAIIDFAELEEFVHLPVKHYSSGMFARLAFAVSVHLDPEVLLVDEVLAVGDYNFQRKCLERIGEMKRNGVTICIVSHARDMISDYCTHALWLEHGRLMAYGDASSVVEQYVSHQNQLEAAGLHAQLQSAPRQRWGTRRVEITRVQILDEQDRPREVFQSGEKMVVSMDYTVHEPVLPPVFGLAIYRQDGLLVCGPNTGFSGLKLPGLKVGGRVAYTIPFLPLLDGLYRLSVSLHTPDGTEIYDYHDREYPFRVVNLPSNSVQERYGLLTVQGVWAHEPDR